jgi:hypothetical protein
MRRAMPPGDGSFEHVDSGAVTQLAKHIVRQLIERAMRSVTVHRADDRRAAGGEFFRLHPVAE